MSDEIVLLKTVMGSAYLIIYFIVTFGIFAVCVACFKLDVPDESELYWAWFSNSLKKERKNWRRDGPRPKVGTGR